VSLADNETLWLGGGILVTVVIAGAVLFWLGAELRTRRARTTPRPPGSPPPDPDPPRPAP
jgi:hypothetical protein